MSQISRWLEVCNIPWHAGGALSNTGYLLAFFLSCTSAGIFGSRAKTEIIEPKQLRKTNWIRILPDQKNGQKMAHVSNPESHLIAFSRDSCTSFNFHECITQFQASEISRFSWFLGCFFCCPLCHPLLCSCCCLFINSTQPPSLRDNVVYWKENSQSNTLYTTPTESVRYRITPANWTKCTANLPKCAVESPQRVYLNGQRIYLNAL